MKNKMAQIGALALALNSGLVQATERDVKGSVELSVGHESSTLDTKLFLDLTDDVNFFHRDRWTTNYEGEASDFHYTAFNLGLGQGFSAGAGLWGTTAAEVKPHVAAQYFGKVGDLTLLQLVSLRSDAQLKSLTNLNYHPEIGNGWQLMAEAENVSIFNPEGHVISLQRLRLGPKYGPLQFGFMADLTETDSGFTYNLGSSIGVGF